MTKRKPKRNSVWVVEYQWASGDWVSTCMDGPKAAHRLAKSLNTTLPNRKYRVTRYQAVR